MKKNEAGKSSNAVPVIAAGLILLAVLATACALQPNQSGDLAALQQTVVAQQTQIAALDEKVSALQRGGGGAAQAPAAATRPPAPPTATPIPRVTDMPVSGTAKGLESAKVTIAEYSDFQ